MRRNFVKLRTLAAILSVAALTGLAGCGGGGDSGVGFQVGMYVDGRASGDYLYAGDVQQVVMPAGSSIELDASEPVVWTLQVGNSYYEGFDTSVYYQGVHDHRDDAELLAHRAGHLHGVLPAVAGAGHADGGVHLRFRDRRDGGRADHELTRR